MGWEVDIGCAGAPEQVPYTDKSFALPFKKRMSSVHNLQALRMLRQIIYIRGYDLVVTHTSLAAFFTRLAIKGMRSRPKLVNVVHGYLFDDSTPVMKRNLLLGAERLTAPETDFLLTMNQYDYEIARRYQLGKRVEMIPGMGVDFVKLDEDSKKDTGISRNTLGISENAFVLICVAEFSRRKSQNVLIQAMNYLPEDTVLILCGSGTELGRCRELVEGSKLERRVLFPGQVENVATWYKTADIAVMASRSEGLPFNVMEAMYLGLPVVASRVKGHIDLVDDGVTGLLYSYGDAKACADAIRYLIESPQICAQFGMKARIAVAQYTLQAVLPNVLSQFGEALAPIAVNANSTSL